MRRITGTIIAYNEEGRIAGSLASLSCCDEVLVVDAESTDRTGELARARGARVITRPWEGYSHQKNFAAEQASFDWILSIDADERLSAELAAEICTWKWNSDSLAAWSMPRRAYYLGRWIRHSGWYPDRKIRLYDRNRADWQGDFVHESLEVRGEIGKLYGDLLHFPYRDWSDHRQRIDRYTSLASEAARRSGRHGSFLKLVLAPPVSFVKTLVFQAGLLDGWRGWVIAAMGARYVFKREVRILRRWNSRLP